MDNKERRAAFRAFYSNMNVNFDNISEALEDSDKKEEIENCFNELQILVMMEIEKNKTPERLELFDDLDDDLDDEDGDIDMYDEEDVDECE